METGLIPALNIPGLSIVEETHPSYILPEIEYTLFDKPVRVIEKTNPFKIDEKKVTELAPLPNESVAAIIIRAGYRPEDFEHALNGGVIDNSESWSTAVKPGNEIVLFPRASGGSWKGILGAVAGMIAIGVLLYFCPILLATFSASALFSTGAAIGAAVMSWALAPGQPKQPDWSTTYDPTGPKSLAQPGVPVPKAYGTMGWGGNVISSFVDYAGKDAYINVLVSYGWGHAKTLAGILINGKAISTYANTSYFVRLGTNDQTPIDGFNKTVNGFPQETQLLVANGPVVVAGTGTDTQGLDVTIKLPSGLYHISHDGNFVPVQVIYKIEVKKHTDSTWISPLFPRNYGPITTTHMDGSITWPKWVVMPTDRFKGSGIVYDYTDDSHTPGEPYTATQHVDVINFTGGETTVDMVVTGEWQPTDPNLGLQEVTGWWQGYRFLNGDNTSPFFDTVSLYGLTPAQWDVRVTKTGYYEPGGDGYTFADATDSHWVTDIWLWNINEITFSDLAYPNMILVGIHALATSQLSGAALQVQATITHDLGEDTVLPTELAGYEHDNPALVAYDVLTNPVYGMNVAATLIDVPAFVAWANFCDESVTNQDGSTARRFIFAGVFDQTGDAWKTLQTIGNMSRASVLQIGMRYSVIMDAPADPVQLFTVGNMKKDSFQEMWVALDDRCTLIECDFADAARNWRMDLPVSVMTATDINSGLQPKVTSTKLIGCTNRDQAWRWAYFHLMGTKLTLRSVQFSAPIEAVCCQVGSVIAIQTDVTQWGVGGRIQPGSSLTSLNIDRNDLTYAPGVGWTVSVQHPVIQRGVDVFIQSISGKTVTMTGPLPAGRILKAIGLDGTEYIVTGTSGNVTGVGAGTGSLILSATPTALVVGQAMTVYDVNVIEDFLVTGWTPGTNGGVLSIASNEFAAVPTPDSAWVYGQSDGFQPAKLFRVISIKKSGDFNFEIGALEYNSLIYEDVTPQYGEIVGTPNVDATVTNLTLTEIFQNGTVTGSSQSSLIAVGWTPGNTTVGGLVEVMAAGGDWRLVANVANGAGCTFLGTIGITYTVRVTGIDRAGNLGSTKATATIAVVAATNAPPDVPLLAGVQGATGGTVLNWWAVSGIDHYEIRYSLIGDWTYAEVLWTGTGTTWTDSANRPGVYMIKAVTSLATGSVESINVRSFQVGVPFSLPFTLVDALVITCTGTTITLALPAQTLTDSTDSLTLTVAAQSIEFTGLTADTVYYVYLFIDYPTLTFWSVVMPPDLPDLAANSGNALAASLGGVVNLGQLAINSTSGVTIPRPHGGPRLPFGGPHT